MSRIVHYSKKKKKKKDIDPLKQKKVMTSKKNINLH